MDPWKSRQGAPEPRKGHGGPPLSPLFPSGTETSGSKRPGDTGLMGVKGRPRSVPAADPSPPATPRAPRGRARPIPAHQPFESPAAEQSARPERDG